MVSRDWHIDDYIELLMPAENTRLAPQFECKARREKVLTKEDITDDLLDECYIMVAKIIDSYGDAYLPIFERLHAEIKAREKQKEMLRKAKNISRDKPTL